VALAQRDERGAKGDECEAGLPAEVYLLMERSCKMKKWYTSKTLWTNALMAVLVIVQYAVGQLWIKAEYEGLIIIVVNMGLRVISGQPIENPLSKPDTTDTTPKA